MVWLVADCGLLSYQITQNYKRVVTLQLCTNTAINYTTGYATFLIMGKNEQIDKLSKKYVKLSAKEIAYAKRVHKRHLRRIAKDIDKPNPQHNRYSGWIG